MHPATPINQDHTNQPTPTAQHFAEFPADQQVATSTLSTQAPRPPLLQASEASKQHNIQGEKIESAKTKEPSPDEQASQVPLTKYNKLKRQFSELREEYLQTISGWEQSTKQLETLTHERKFLHKKLQYFLASKYNAPQISDEELTAILLSQSASLQSRPANPGQARNATQTSIGKANGHSRNIAAQNGLNGIASFDEHENGDSVREAKLQRHLKNMTEHEREKFLEELQNSQRRSANEKHARGKSATQAPDSLQQQPEGEQSSKIKISFAQLNGAQAKVVVKNAQKMSANNMVQIVNKQQKLPHQGSLPQLPPASAVIGTQQQHNGMQNHHQPMHTPQNQQQPSMAQQQHGDLMNRVNYAPYVKP